MAHKTRNRGPRSAAGSSARATRKTPRSGRTENNHGVPDVYQSMLAEAGEDDSAHDSDPPLKRRKVAAPAKSSPPKLEPTATEDRNGHRSTKLVPSTEQQPSRQRLQTVENSSDSDESEFDFEDVELDLSNDDREDEIQDVSISLESESSTKRHTNQRRKPVSVVEKAHRVFVHKLHILCLLQHCVFVNGRCNNILVHRRLRPLITPKIVSFLNPKIEHSQFQRNGEFLDGLQQARDAFVTNYRVTASGLVKAKWDALDNGGAAQDYGEAVDRTDFMTAAKNLEGSQDVGNQLFCALLRAAGVEARLVCSLQILSFTNPTKTSTPQKSIKPSIYIDASTRHQSVKPVVTHDTAVQSSASIGKVPSARRRLGQPGFSTAQSPVPTKKAKPVRKLSYPVFWVEAFNAAHQKWVPIDPIVTHTIGKPGKLEPPSSYDPNQMLYVMAFESNGVARDVTRRYAKAYNAKTRRHRVEATGEEGAQWWKKITKIFRRRGETLDRDQVEDAELAQKEAREGMPANILDFKDHPYYALDRHLKRHEVIHPKREVGKVNAGTAANPRMEAVYRRQDVLICRSADKWYRLGRVIQQGEQPLKQVTARNRRNQTSNEDDHDGDVPTTTGLYAPYQTEQYVPPPVQRGRITKNAYGNLDVYVPSMVPAGGTHIQHNLAQQAARFLRIDYANAVTGFQFKGRHGTAIINGVVVAERYTDAVRAIIEGFEDDVEEDQSRARSLQALRLWKRFLVGLRIAERVKSYGDASNAEPVDSGNVDDEVEKMEAAQDSGGFFPGESDEAPLRTAGRFDVSELAMRSKSPRRTRRKSFSDDESGNGIVSEPDDASEPNEGHPEWSHELSDEGGGFLVDDDAEEPVGEAIQSHTHDQDEDMDAGGAGGGLFAEDGDDHGDLFEDEPGAHIAPNNDAPGHHEHPQATDLEQSDSNSPAPQHADEMQLSFDDHRSSAADEAGQIPEPNTVKPEPRAKAASETRAASGEPGSDHGSMLSHDPEDEDLEPDWLESD